jgi:hypothetical protein
MSAPPTTGVMSFGTCLSLLVLGLGGPLGFVALVIVLPLLHARHGEPVLTKLHAPVLSPTHWNLVIVSEAQADQGTYASNFRSAQDPEMENEAERNYRAYPVGTVISKHHFQDLKTARANADELFITRMIRTAATHGQQHDPWRYQRIAVGGEIQLDGFADAPAIQAQCAACHANAERRDFIFAHHLGDQ